MAAEVLRVLGEATLGADPTATDQAQALFSDAVRIADRQGALMFGARSC